MILLQRFAERWLEWALAASWQLAILVCIVGLACAALRSAAPRLRHALWLLVLVKVFLPPGLSAPWSVGRWAIDPALARFGTSQQGLLEKWRLAPITGEPAVGVGLEDQVNLNVAIAVSLPVLLLGVWAIGCAVFLAIVCWRYARLTSAIRRVPPIDEGPLRVELEQIAIELGLLRVPDLCVTNQLTSPFLFGVLQPCIVLPAKSLSELSEGELRAVLTHELVHFQRYDTWIGWVQVLAQSLFWFHPLVRWANGQIRHERETVCDEAVLRQGALTPKHYGESIVHVLTASHGRSLVAGSLVGIFERGVHLQNRLENIMNFTPNQNEFGWAARLVVAALAIAFLPMSSGAAPGIAADGPNPLIVKTSPEVGATGVDPSLSEITVTFDRDMGTGMSWTGSPPEFPPIDESRKPIWKDLRTCALPVKLEKASFYRLGINSAVHQNFRSAAGSPALPSAIFFTTKGATADVEAQVKAPEVVSMEPNNGAMTVDPKTAELKVTFNMPMNSGMSWTGGGPSFPKLAEGKKASWSADGLTCTLPVVLEPGHDYQLGLNNANHKNFQSKGGVPLEPVVYRFRTAGAK